MCVRACVRVCVCVERVREEGEGGDDDMGFNSSDVGLTYLGQRERAAATID